MSVRILSISARRTWYNVSRVVEEDGGPYLELRERNHEGEAVGGEYELDLGVARLVSLDSWTGRRHTQQCGRGRFGLLKTSCR